MANVTTKTAEITYTLELSEREANALAQLLVAANTSEGEGDVLDDVYTALFEAGAESTGTYHENDGEYITVFRRSGR